MAPTTASHRPPPAEILARGSTVGRYVIVDVIGHGGMGVVYAAYDSQLDRKLAIKLLRPDLLSLEHSQEAESRLLREAQAMAKLAHPNVVTVHDVGTHDGRVFLAMEFVEGVTLRDWLRTTHPFRERLRVVCDAGKGLAAAHAVGLVHRDFKPDNVIVAKGGRVVVLDFGLARAQTDTAPEAPYPELKAESQALFPRGTIEDPLYTPLTRGGKMLGTVGYMAPELGFAETANALTDQFSFAATAYVALYGERPFPSTVLAEYLTEVHDGPREPAANSAGVGGGRDVPLRVRRIVLRGLSPDAKHRYPTINAMLTALGHDPSGRRRRLMTAAALLLGLGVVVFAIGYAAKQRQLICAADLSELAPAWGAPVRAAMVESFEKSDAPHARESADRISKRIDEFAEQWADTRAEVCRATRVRKQQPEDVFRLRNDCLDRERTQLGALTSMLVKADAALVKKSVEIAYGLPQISWCNDVSTLRASAGLPDDPTKRSIVVDVRTKLAQSDSKALAGDAKEAYSLAIEAVALARTTADDPTVAEALLNEGQVLRRQGAFAQALPPLREALFLAAGSGVDSITVRAASLLAFITGSKLKRVDESRIWLDTARAALARMGGNEELELDVMHPEATMLNEVDWRPDLALTINLKIVATTRRLYGASPKTTIALHNVGDTYVNLGEMAQARPYLEEAVAMAESIGGTTFGSLGISASELGKCLVLVGEFSLGEKAARRAIAIFDANGMDYWETEPFDTLAWAALVRGDIPSALSAGEQSLAHFVKAGRPAVAISEVNLAAAFPRIHDGHPDAALPLCDEALAEQEREDSIDPRRSYMWDALRCKGEALMALGRSVEAVPYLERSLPLHRRMVPGDYARLEFSLARALALSHGDEARIHELAKAARDEFAHSPFLAFEQAEVDAFLAKAGGR